MVWASCARSVYRLRRKTRLHQQLGGAFQRHPRAHPEDPETSYNMSSNDPNPEPRYTPMKVNRHVGGVTSLASNRVCGVGVAYQATNGGIQVLDSHVTDLAKAKSPIFNQQHTDICSASWGPEDKGGIVKGPSTLANEVLMRGASRVLCISAAMLLRGLPLNVHGDLGSIYVWGCGNSGTSRGNCNLGCYTSSIHMLSVSSTTESGKSPFYIELCAAFLTAAYSGSSLHHRTVVGTSASARLVAWITALVLEANPALTWRDVQHTTIQPSRPSHLRSDDWQTNGVGRPGILSKFQLELYGTKECMKARRVERTPVWKCLILSSNGSCTECTYPLYLFENACLPSCPPHYYEWGNSTQSPRRCQSCHHSCHTCFGHRKTNCLDCPPFSTLDPRLSTCSTPAYPWDHQTEVGESMKWSGLILSILFGGPLVLACFLCAAAWAVHGIIQFRKAARSQARGNGNFGDFRGVEGAALNEVEESHSL
ncbi:proprotein convertase subtilisin/kexin type 4-like isoform X4 [Brienomyrus brachyistius]|uniref:proprotein convertase subtilisin/kexin type 4-like isoform X4 n=1 Tax=Brienomyrus brachyistius TaxID=42636 RepID=UPI0020B183DB|nr:proprotein convertase subtilisin/kexin type 4-like isoform X4 [Brienomyrus brachyistius]